MGWEWGLARAVPCRAVLASLSRDLPPEEVIREFQAKW